MSRNYKYSFADQLLIHAQRPDASACAGYDVWTGRMGRYVRRGAKGIALVDNTGDAPRLRYVFDVSDTGARRASRTFEPWQVNSENTSAVASALEACFSVEPRVSLAEQLEVVAAQLADEYWLDNSGDILGIVDGSFLEGYDEFTIGVKFRNAAVVSLTHSLLTRCGFEPENYLTPENFEDVFEWNTPEAASALGMAVSSINQTVLREIERSIRSYERSLHNDRTNLHDSKRRTDSRPDLARDSADRTVREDASTLPQGEPTGAVEPPSADRDAVRSPARDRDSGAEPHRPDAAETRGGGGRDGGTKSRRPNEVDGTDEQLQSPGRRSSSERVNLQLNLFDEAEDADTPSAFSCSQEVVDAVLRVGENTSYLHERVVAEFEKQRSLDEIAAFLPTVYHGGVGVVVDGERYAAWMSTDGIRIAQGNAARYERDVHLVTWGDASRRIDELLDAGQYAGEWELERSTATERELLAQQMVYLYRDLADGQDSNFFPSLDGIKSGLFPDVTERVAAMLSDREQCEKLLGEYRDFLKAYSADRSVLRFNYHNTNEILNSLESQLLPRVQFHADTELIPSPHQFITQDEIDKLLRDGGSTSGGKWRIFRYFTEAHSVEDKADFLKREYGIGGRSHALSDAPGSNENHDAKGIELSKGGCENVSLTWRQIARRIDTLIASNRFMTAAELAMYDTHTAAYASYNRAKPHHDNDIVLVQYGGAFYTYGADAETTAHALGQRTRQAGGLDYVEIMEEQIEPALDALRTYKPVTFSYENGTELTVDFHLPGDMRAQYEQQLYDTLMANESYINAVMNPDAESAALTGERVLREFVADSEDRDFQRAYYDNPRLREALNRVALDAAYHDLSEPPAEDEPELDDTPVNIQPREPMASAYGVGDFVWFEGREYQITDLQRGYVELLPPGMAIPVYRTESRADFERGLHSDERNRYITNYLTTEADNDAREPTAGGDATKFQEKTVAYYDAEKAHLPYDVVFQTIGSASEPEPTQPEPSVSPETPRNFHITDEHLGESGAKARFRANMDAVTTLKRIEAEGRAATADEQETLSRYTGWGAIPDAFDESKSDWAKECAELKATLTPEEYEAARGSTLNAHYTSPTVIRAIYDALGSMGFEGGKILEPSMGVGNFFGLLPESMAGSELHGVELDSITGRIAQQLYPEAEITVVGFETTNRPGFYDVALGNVPFGNYQVFDPEYNRLGFSIHNYFAAKMLDQVRPGGIVAFVTSRYTMDAKDESVRRYLAARGELLGAIRLPNNAFRANAGTDVVTDIIFLQRREAPLTELPDWVQVGENEDGFKVNQYFLDHPEMVLGTPTSESTQYAAQDYTVAPIDGADLAAQLHEAIQYIHGEYVERDIEENAVSDIMPASPDVRNYSFTLVGGDVYYREGRIMVRQDVSAAMTERIKSLMELRDCTRRLIELQTMDAGDAEITAEQRQLNELYDTFTAKHGLISSRENKRAFDADSSYYLLCSLEILDEDGRLERKSDMFTKRTIQPHRPVEHTDTAVEALAVSMNERARVDLPYMARLCSRDEAAVAAELQGVIFRVPGTDRYVTADEYLSGDVCVKLREAEAAAESDAAFNINVEALRAAQPRELTASEIDVRLGATWIEPQYIKQFIDETFKPAFWASQSIKVHYSPVTGEWRVDGKSAVGANDVNAYNTYGTQRMNAYKILENTLNLRDVRIYDRVEDADGTERRVLNSKETTLAQQKQQVIKDAFKDWLWKDQQRRETLVAKYNELFNSIKPREYDGSHLTFPGMNPEIELRQHQRDAIARILYGGNTLLAHEVGAGKTFTMAAAAMEAKRLGLCSKPMFVVPNHLTEQWASEFLRLYPSANILVTTKKDFEKANRQKFCARIATGDYDAVIIGHSQFEKIPVSQERQEQLLQDQIDELAEGIRELKRANGERFSIKAMERTKKGLEAKLKKLLDSPKDDVVTFEELGVDRLFVDEAHSFKNLFYQTKMQNVAGLSSAEAQKSSDMYMKSRYLDEKTGSKGVVFATGTPVSNTMVEVYTMQRYLQHDALERLGLNHFDAWAANFGETVTAMELAPEGYNF